MGSSPFEPAKVGSQIDFHRDAGDLTVPNYFLQVTRALNCPERLEMARRKGLKTVALVGVALPEELFWACGAAPISLARLVSVGQVDNLSHRGRLK